MCGSVRDGPVTGLSGSNRSHSTLHGCSRGFVTQTRVASTQLSPSFLSVVGKPTWSNVERSSCTVSPPCTPGLLTRRPPTGQATSSLTALRLRSRRAVELELPARRPAERTEQLVGAVRTVALYLRRALAD